MDYDAYASAVQNTTKKNPQSFTKLIFALLQNSSLSNVKKI